MRKSLHIVAFVGILVIIGFHIADRNWSAALGWSLAALYKFDVVRAEVFPSKGAISEGEPA